MIARKRKNTSTRLGNGMLDEIVDSVRTMKSESKSLAKEFQGCVEEILGAAQSIGCAVK